MLAYVDREATLLRGQGRVLAAWTALLANGMLIQTQQLRATSVQEGGILMGLEIAHCAPGSALRVLHTVPGRQMNACISYSRHSIGRGQAPSMLTNGWRIRPR